MEKIITLSVNANVTADVFHGPSDSISIYIHVHVSVGRFMSLFFFLLNTCVCANVPFSLCVSTRRANRIDAERVKSQPESHDLPNTIRLTSLPSHSHTHTYSTPPLKRKHKKDEHQERMYINNNRMCRRVVRCVLYVSSINCSEIPRLLVFHPLPQTVSLIRYVLLRDTLFHV